MAARYRLSYILECRKYQRLQGVNLQIEAADSLLTLATVRRLSCMTPVERQVHLIVRIVI